MSVEETNKVLSKVSDLKDLTIIEKNKSEAYEFLSEHLLSDLDLEQKTEISHPAIFSALDVYIDYFESLKLFFLAKRLRRLKESLMKHLISHRRLGRKELVEMVKALGVPINTDQLEDIKKRRNLF